MTFRLTGARWITLATVIALSAVSLPGPALGVGTAADATPPSEQITLDVQTVNGSGCPAGTASASMLSDNTGFRINYSSFLAQDLLVHIPQGFTFAIARADYWGRLHLESGATALERANYYFQGSSDNTYVDHTFSGPLDGAWRTTDITSAAELVYAPCGVTRGLNINTELRVDAGASSKTSYISMRASDGEVYTIVQFQWKQC